MKTTLSFISETELSRYYSSTKANKDSLRRTTQNIHFMCNMSKQSNINLIPIYIFGAGTKVVNQKI